MAPRIGRSALFFIAATLCAQSKLTMFPPVRGLHEMVGSTNNFEVDAGMRILALGGNAVDAGVATTLAAGVTELDHFGLGGEIPILIKLAGKPVVVISGNGTAPQRATVAFYKARKRELWEEPGPHGGDLLKRRAYLVFTGPRRNGWIDPGLLTRYGTPCRSLHRSPRPPSRYFTDGFPDYRSDGRLDSRLTTATATLAHFARLLPARRQWLRAGGTFSVSRPWEKRCGHWLPQKPKPRATACSACRPCAITSIKVLSRRSMRIFARATEA